MRDVYLNNVLRERWNDATRIVTFYNASGAQSSTRAYTADEITVADATAATANRLAIESNLTTALASLRVIRDDTNANINQNPAARIKDIAKTLLEIDRYLLRRFDGTA